MTGECTQTVELVVDIPLLPALSFMHLLSKPSSYDGSTFCILNQVQLSSVIKFATQLTHCHALIKFGLQVQGSGAG